MTSPTHAVPFCRVYATKKLSGVLQNKEDYHVAILLSVDHLVISFVRCAQYVTGQSARTFLGRRSDRNFSRDGQGLGDMASAEYEPTMRVWGRSPGAETLVQRSGGEAPTEGESFEAFVCLKEGPKFCYQYAKTVYLYVWAAVQGDCLSVFQPPEGTSAPPPRTHAYGRQ